MKKIIILFLIVLALVINFFSFNKTHDWGDDYAGYVIQAQTVSSGNYSLLKENMQKNDYILNYPWGFPLLLSPVIGYFQAHIVVVKVYIYFFFVLSLLLSFYLFRNSGEDGLLTVLLMASSPYFWEFKNYLLADFPNLFFVLLTLFLANKAFLAPPTGKKAYVSWALIGLCTYISYMMRNQSLVLLPVIALSQLFFLRKRILEPKNLLILLLPGLVFLICIGLSGAFLPVRSVSYLNQYQHLQIRKTLWENSFYYMNVWKELFLTTDVINKFPELFTGFILTFVISGLLSSMKQHLFFFIFFFASLFLVMISPFYQGIRYLIPLIPFFFYFFMLGFRNFIFSTVNRKQYKEPLFYLVTGLIVLLSLKTIFSYTMDQNESRVEVEGPYKKTSSTMFQFIRNVSRPGDIIGFCKPRAMLLYTGRNAVVPGSFEDCLQRHVAYFVYYYKGSDQPSLESLTGHADQVEQVFSNTDFVVLKIKT